MSEPRAPSWWQARVAQKVVRPPLDRSIEADVCIVGAGLTGLWTAYELLGAQPDLRVVVLDRRYVGFGASGRNGGWVVGELSGSREAWLRRCGSRAAVIAQEQAIAATVDAVGAVVALEEIACDWVKGGSLHVATSPPQLARVRALIAHDRAWGVEDTELLDANGLAGRVAVRGGLGAHFRPQCARVQPAALVAGLALAAERRGAILYDQSAVTAIEPHVARTAAGDVRARWVVRATEGYTADLAGHHRDLLPMTSSMVMTEPLGRDAWRSLGWDGAETMLDGAHAYAYLQRTADGRIAIGGRGVPYAYGSRTGREGPLPSQTVAALRARLVSLFGSAVDVPLAGSWHGVLGVSRTWLPSVGVEKSGLAWAGGYAGEGVAAANLAGRTLRDLILDVDSPLVHLPWVHPPARRWEPEPLRWLGVHAVYALFHAADARERRTGRSSRFAGAADLLAGR